MCSRSSAEQAESGLEALERPCPRAGVPVESPRLAENPRCAGASRAARYPASTISYSSSAAARRPIGPSRSAIRSRATSCSVSICPPARHSARARRAPAGSAGSRPRSRTSPRPIAGRHQVPCASALVGCRGPSDGPESPSRSRLSGPADALGLEGRAHARVQLGATGHEDVLVHDLPEEPVAEVGDPVPGVTNRRGRARRAPRPPRRARPRSPGAAPRRSEARSPPLPG